MGKLSKRVRTPSYCFGVVSINNFTICNSEMCLRKRKLLLKIELENFPREFMSTITVVKKNGYAAIAADTLTSWGYIKQTSEYLLNHQKITEFGNSFIALAGSMTVSQSIRNYLAGLKNQPDL